ncbi:unnamed protein product [Strongylus vulgaris]|uniref:Uncharacterized protein n=1 Tax=Strongylus vulgaris TaxID=40348 RepID=A0A3P7I6Y8_STRVU|nr:unnamed protein product [Strongylus vulgaris]
MNLYTPGNGLFGTHVTWEDIEEDMQRELHTNSSFGPNKTAQNIGDGKGFMSRIVLIDPDWQQKDKDLPKKFIVKVSLIEEILKCLCKLSNTQFVKILTQLAIQNFANEMSKKNETDNLLGDEEFKVTFEKQQKAVSFIMRLPNKFLL